MAEVIIMPKLGFNMDEGQLVKWNKKVEQVFWENLILKKSLPLMDLPNWQKQHMKMVQ